MKSFLDFLTSQVQRIAGFIDAVLGMVLGFATNMLSSVLGLAEQVVNTGMRVLLCVLVYKIVFQDFLLNLFQAL